MKKILTKKNKITGSLFYMRVFSTNFLIEIIIAMILFLIFVYGVLKFLNFKLIRNIDDLQVQLASVSSEFSSRTKTKIAEKEEEEQEQEDMKQSGTPVPAANLTVGMVLANPVFDRNKQMIVGKNTALTLHHIVKIRESAVNSVNII